MPNVKSIRTFSKSKTLDSCQREFKQKWFAVSDSNSWGIKFKKISDFGEKDLGLFSNELFKLIVPSVAIQHCVLEKFCKLIS